MGDTIKKIAKIMTWPLDDVLFPDKPKPPKLHFPTPAGAEAAAKSAVEIAARRRKAGRRKTILTDELGSPAVLKKTLLGE